MPFFHNFFDQNFTLGISYEEFPMWEGIGLDTEGAKNVRSARKYSENGFQGFLGEIFFEFFWPIFHLGNFSLGAP